MRIFDIWLAYRISFYCFILIGWMLMPIMKNFFSAFFIPRKAFKIDDKGMKIHPLYNIVFLWSHDIASNQHHGMYLSLYILPLMIRFISSAQTNERHIAAIIIKCSCVACRKQKKSVFYRAVERIFNLQFFFLAFIIIFIFSWLPFFFIFVL